MCQQHTIRSHFCYIYFMVGCGVFTRGLLWVFCFRITTRKCVRSYTRAGQRRATSPRVAERQVTAVLAAPEEAVAGLPVSSVTHSSPGCSLRSNVKFTPILVKLVFGFICMLYHLPIHIPWCIVLKLFLAMKKAIISMRPAGKCILIHNSMNVIIGLIVIVEKLLPFKSLFFACKRKLSKTSRLLRLAATGNCPDRLGWMTARLTTAITCDTDSQTKET